MVMRHAKSSWKSGVTVDHDRPLNKRGRRDAPRIAERLHELGWIPERVVSSSSERTRQTWAGMASRFPNATVEYTEDLYLSDTDVALAAIGGFPDALTTVMLLGHNPTFEELLEDLGLPTIVLTTANVALLHGQGSSWSEALRQGFHLVEVVRPREL